jgi:putative ABC transport system permease protein
MDVAPRRFAMTSDLIQDLRYAARLLARAPGFTLTAAITLALGIGATTLMFSIVNAVLWRPLPFPDPDRLLVVFSIRQPGIGEIRATALDFQDWRARAVSFESLAAHVGTGFTFTGSGDPELVIGQVVTTDFFRVLGVRPMLGRTFAADEFTPGRETRVVLSHRLWQRRFGGNPDVVGRTTTINGRAYVVVGVMPAGFVYPNATYQLWAPLPSPPTPEMPPANRASHYLQVVGRLKPNVTPAHAQAEIAGIAAALAQQFPETNQNLTAGAAPLSDYTVRDVKTPLYVLLAAVSLVVLIACANVTNLLLARASARSREVAVRQALGAGRWRLVRQFLTESMTLYAIGAGGALALAAWGLSGIVALQPGGIPRLNDASIDARVLAATLAVTFLTSVIFGLAPVAQGARVSPIDALKSGPPGSGVGPARQRLRMALVVGELALAVALLVGAGLAIRSLARLSSVNPGFDADAQLTFGIVMPAARYATHEQMIAFVDRLTDAVKSGAGVQHAGATTHLPLSGQNLENGFTVEGFVPAHPGEVPIAGMRGVTADYFAALGVPLEAGRPFTSSDRLGSQSVAIVNETFAKRYWPGQSAVGKHLVESGSEGPMRTVVGVIADIRHNGLAEDPRPEVDIPYSQLDPDFLKTWARGLTYVVRSAVPLVDTLAGARTDVAAVDPLMPLLTPRTIGDVASETLAEPRFRTWLLGGFAVLALSLATVGVFGVLAFYVLQRTREIGIRVALGASSTDIVRMIMARGLALAGAGITLGAAAAIPLALSMRSLLFGVAPLDALTLAGSAAALGIVAAAASYIPARRALAIEPVSALRLE